MTDPIADYLIRLRNTIKMKHRAVEVPAPSLKKEITKIPFDKGYTPSFRFVEDGPQDTIKIALKYNLVNKVSAIKRLERASTFGLCKYTGYKEMSGVLDSLGIIVLSTSKSMITDREARDLEIGGEVLCHIY